MSARFKAAIGAAGLALVASAILAVGPAEAATSCESTLQEREQTGLNAFRAGAICTRIDSNRRVRAWLIRDGGPDYYSQYFNRTNVYHFTNWYTCYAGCRDAYQVAPA